MTEDSPSGPESADTLLNSLSESMLLEDDEYEEDDDDDDDNEDDDDEDYKTGRDGARRRRSSVKSSKRLSGAAQEKATTSRKKKRSSRSAKAGRRGSLEWNSDEDSILRRCDHMHLFNGRGTFETHDHVGRDDFTTLTDDETTFVPFSECSRRPPLLPAEFRTAS